ncbi:SANT/Myb_domain [Hexamita inflata]|uniref:SANT/Myb domain n=1 Tax=Hexamita inflata TaxID=28002 RepID=A0AA86RVQ4_9EUKA|nr:SANT/Myb domain [Hexamita inflata]
MIFHQKHRWTEEEDELFYRLLEVHDTNFKEMVPHFNNRSYNQIRSHYYNFIHRTEIENQHPMTAKVETKNDKLKKESNFKVEVNAPIVITNSPNCSPSSSVTFKTQESINMLDLEAQCDISYYSVFELFE